MEEIVFPEEIYVAIYDAESGQIKKIGQEWAFPNEEHKIFIDQDFIESVHSGEIKLHKCFVDFESGDIQVAEIQTIVKIDDVLHRVPLKEYSYSKNPDISIVYDRQNKKLSIELNEDLRETQISTNKQKVKRNIIWSGDTSMKFYVTSFNDPHILLNMFSVTLQQLKNKSFEKSIDLPLNFSVYTRRLLKNYVCEII